ncbi:MAG: hypothetical protein GY841_22355, partial [FCB group bacterium]|nr:hypothetical protein [FCB group bacterium]
MNTRKIWNQHAYSITNVEDDGSIPRIAANNWETYNNFRQNQMLDPLGCMDLTASRIRLDPSGHPASAGIIARVGNGGVLHTAPGINVAFYNGDPAEGGSLLGVAETQTRLYPGEYEDVALAWSAPPEGLHAVYVIADDDGAGQGKEHEVDEENNQAHAIVSIGQSLPSAHAGPDRTVNRGAAITLDGSSSSDPEGDPLTLAWSLARIPPGSAATLSDPSAIAPSFTADLPGVYYVQLIVHDGTGPSHIDMA